jgi:EmrB/QacA subfamily drug resistance transporter
VVRDERSLLVKTTFTSGQRWVIGLTSVASFMVALDLLVVSTALPLIKLDLGASLPVVQWTVTGYGLAFAVLLMAGAALGDRFGRRRVFTIGLVLFAAASACCALAPGVGWLIAARVIQGAAAALVMPLAVALLGAELPDDRRGRALGMFEGLTGLATIAGPPVGGTIAYLVGWEWVFWLNVPIALVLIPLVLWRIEESTGSDTALDVPGMALVTAGAFGLVWGLVRGQESGWSSPEVLGALAVGSGLVLVFVWWEMRCGEPMLPMSLFGNRSFSSPTAASFLLFASLYGTVFFLSQYMQVGLGYSALEAGVRLIPWTATLLVVAPLAGALADRLGNRPVLVTGLLLKTVGLGGLGVVAASSEGSYLAVLLALIVEGAGTSMAIPVVQSAMLGAVSPQDIGKASGVNGVTQELGGVFGVAVLVALFAVAGSYASPQAFTAGFTIAIGTCAVFAFGAAVVALGTSRQSSVVDDEADGRAVDPA